MKYFETGKHENTKLKEALSLGKNEIGHKSQKKKKRKLKRKRENKNRIDQKRRIKSNEVENNIGWRIRWNWIEWLSAINWRGNLSHNGNVANCWHFQVNQFAFLKKCRNNGTKYVKQWQNHNPTIIDEWLDKTHCRSSTMAQKQKNYQTEKYALQIYSCLHILYRTPHAKKKQTVSFGMGIYILILVVCTITIEKVTKTKQFASRKTMRLNWKKMWNCAAHRLWKCDF